MLKQVEEDNLGYRLTDVCPNAINSLTLSSNRKFPCPVVSLGYVLA